MAARQALIRFVLAPLRLVSWGFAFYFSSIVLVVLALVPSAIRGYQMYTGYTPESLEIILWIMRIGLFVAIVWIGRKKREKIVLRELTFLIVVELIATAVWQYLWFQYAIIPGLKLVTEAVSSEAVMEWFIHLTGSSSIDVQALSKSVLFILKNIFVIPMYVMFLLRIVKII